jgi:hypothetical protein
MCTITMQNVQNPDEDGIKYQIEFEDVTPVEHLYHLRKM